MSTEKARGIRLALVPVFASVNVALTVAWIGVVVLLNHTLRRQAAETQSEHL